MVEKTNNPAMENKKINSLWMLDVLRGFSALLIVLYHYTTQYEKSIGHVEMYGVSIPWGCHAVYMFFMLSGFLIVYTYKENFNIVSFISYIVQVLLIVFTGKNVLGADVKVTMYPAFGSIICLIGLIIMTVFIRKLSNINKKIKK